MTRRLRLPAIGCLVAVGLALAASPAAFADDSVTPLCNGQPCVSGWWYTSPVAVTWQVSTNPPPGPTVDCAGVQPTSRDLIATTSCEAVWYANGQPSDDIKRTYTVHVELSAPSASAALARPPDSNGWYNHGVAVSFGGSSFSGIASCTPTTTYAGPDVSNTTVNGACTDNAGKTASASASLNYDATPPTVTGATPSRAPDSNGWYTHPVSFTFTGTDSVSGIESCDTVTYRGPGSGSVLGGCRDRAGNSTTGAFPVRYRPGSSPVSNARVASLPLLLRWSAAPHAGYYNLQVYRAGRKVLSAWPTQPSLRLSRSWTFAGHRFHLKPGRYRWYVWPGYGSRAGARYGPVIVAKTFRVAKRP